VDIIVVTKLSEDEWTPAEALKLFEPFLDKHYKGKWRPQGRSFGIELSLVDLDLVITSAPSESEEGILKSQAVVTDEDLEIARDWKLNKSWVPLEGRFSYEPNLMKIISEAQKEPEWRSEPLRIPDRNANEWESTHPLEQIRWTRDKNFRCNTNFVNVVKALKWWRLDKYSEPAHPKGFPLERLIGECCPDGIECLAKGITLTLETIVSNYRMTIALGGKPELPDYGVSSHDVFKRISESDFKAFYEQAEAGAVLARQALDSTDRVESGNLWRELLGNKFPKPPENSNKMSTGGFTAPSAAAVPGSGRFAR
jgi:hypothetical protein